MNNRLVGRLVEGIFVGVGISLGLALVSRIIYPMSVHFIMYLGY